MRLLLGLASLAAPLLLLLPGAAAAQGCGGQDTYATLMKQGQTAYGGDHLAEAIDCFRRVAERYWELGASDAHFWLALSLKRAAGATNEEVRTHLLLAAQGARSGVALLYMAHLGLAELDLNSPEVAPPEAALSALSKVDPLSARLLLGVHLGLDGISLLIQARMDILSNGTPEDLARIDAAVALVYAMQLDHRADADRLDENAWLGAWEALQSLDSHDTNDGNFAALADWLLTFSTRHGLGSSLPPWVLPRRAAITDAAGSLADTSFSPPSIRVTPESFPGTSAEALAATQELLERELSKRFGTLGDELRNLRLGDTDAPKLQFRGLTDNLEIKTAQDRVHVAVSASDGGGVAALRWELFSEAPGRTTPIRSGNVATNGASSIEAVETVPLLPAQGRAGYRLHFEARDRSGKSASRDFHVVQDPMPRKRVAYLIGVSNYESARKRVGTLIDLPRLIEKDIKGLEHRLVIGGYQVEPLVDADATYEWLGQIRDPLEVYGSDAEIIVYYTGHGDRNRQGESCVYVTSGDCYPIRRLLEDISKVRARRITVIVDACYSGDPQGLSLTGGEDRLFVASTALDRKAKLDPEGSRFTRSLLAALRSASIDTRYPFGMITADEAAHEAARLLRTEWPADADAIERSIAGQTGAVLAILEPHEVALAQLARLRRGATVTEQVALDEVKKALGSTSPRRLGEVATDVLLDLAHGKIESTAEVRRTLQVFADALRGKD